MQSKLATKLGHSLAKGLGIKLEPQNEELARGESISSFVTADTYVEREPTSGEWLREVTPNGKGVLRYLYTLFPFTHWIGRYNLQWLYGDLVAGMWMSQTVYLYQ
jgi:sodium-independent sulfate anion transporter 11